MKEKYDQIELYCPKLGHHLTFKYCRSENMGIPCSRVIKCCSDKIPIQTYIHDHFSRTQVEKIFKGPVTKINSILQIVQQVHKE
jgi:hypothetical protein